MIQELVDFFVFWTKKQFSSAYEKITEFFVFWALLPLIRKRYGW